MKYDIYLVIDHYGNKCDRRYVYPFNDINKAFQAIEQYYKEDVVDKMSLQRYEVREQE